MNDKYYVKERKNDRPHIKLLANRKTFQSKCICRREVVYCMSKSFYLVSLLYKLDKTYWTCGKGVGSLILKKEYL